MLVIHYTRVTCPYGVGGDGEVVVPHGGDDRGAHDVRDVAGGHNSRHNTPNNLLSACKPARLR